MGTLAVVPYALLLLFMFIPEFFSTIFSLFDVLITFLFGESAFGMAGIIGWGVLFYAILITCLFSGFAFGLTGIIKVTRNAKLLWSVDKISLPVLFGIPMSVIGVIANLWYLVFFIPSVLAVL